MTAIQAREWFLALPAQSKPFVVALLAHNLTIAARGWVPGTRADEMVAERYWAFNELQHTISSKLLALYRDEGLGFPDEGFLDVLFDKAAHRACEAALLQAFAWSRTAFERLPLAR